MTSRRTTIAAILLIISPLVFLVLEATATSAWNNPPYSYRWDAVSDIGNPHPHDFLFGQHVNSPWYFVQNFAFLVQGVTFAIIVIMLFRLVSGRRRYALAVTGLAHALGMLLVSVFSQQSVNGFELLVHEAGAALILVGTALEVLVGLLTVLAGAALWYRILSVILGITGFISFASLILIPAVGTVVGGGLGERIALYGFFVWEIITGISLLVRSRRVGSLPVTLARAPEGANA